MNDADHADLCGLTQPRQTQLRPTHPRAPLRHPEWDSSDRICSPFWMAWQPGPQVGWVCPPNPISLLTLSPCPSYGETLCGGGACPSQALQAGTPGGTAAWAWSTRHPLPWPPQHVNPKKVSNFPQHSHWPCCSHPSPARPDAQTKNPSCSLWCLTCQETPPILTWEDLICMC